MRSVIYDLFGVYTPVYYTDSDGIDIIPSGMAGVDWTWVAGVILFAITLYCVFRLVGVIFSHDYRRR